MSLQPVCDVCSAEDYLNYQALWCASAENENKNLLKLFLLHIQKWNGEMHPHPPDHNPHAWWPMNVSFLLALLAKYLRPLWAHGPYAMVSVAQPYIAVKESNICRVLMESTLKPSHSWKHLQQSIGFSSLDRWSIVWSDPHLAFPVWASSLDR